MGAPPVNLNVYHLNKPIIANLCPGYHASTESEYAHSFAEALSMSEDATSAMRKRARVSSKRFTEEMFAAKWVEQLGKLIEIQRSPSK